MTSRSSYEAFLTNTSFLTELLRRGLFPGNRQFYSMSFDGRGFILLLLTFVI